MLAPITMIGKRMRRLSQPWRQNVGLVLEHPTLVILLHNPPTNMTPADNDDLIAQLRQRSIAAGDQPPKEHTIVVSGTTINATVVSTMTRGLTTTVAVRFQ